MLFRSEKSSNPLSPSIAGPIAGVEIQSPKTIAPAAASQIAVDKQPVTFTVNNATSNGVRPLTYIFEISADSSFAAKLFTQSGIEPGSGGKTSLTLPQSLSAERTYYWRAKADDGANASAYSAPSAFTIYTPVVIQAPALVEPAADATGVSRKPTFKITNAVRTGPAGAMQYLFEVATDSAMASKVISTIVNEASATTAYPAVDDLAYATRYYWRVKAADPGHESGYSAIRTFTTLAAPVVAPTPAPSPTPNPSVAVARDAINMSAASIHNSPWDLAAWPISTALTSIDLSGSGMRVEFSKKDGAGRWPDVTPPGWSGPLQYTLGMCVSISGSWHCSAVVEFWHGLDRSGGAPQDVARNWFYDAIRWGPMVNYQPAVGEQVGFFVCGGDCRNNTAGDLSPVKERTNVVLISYPGAGGGFFQF